MNAAGSCLVSFRKCTILYMGDTNFIALRVLINKNENTMEVKE